MATSGIASKSPEWIEATKAKIREAFDLFDASKSGAIIQEEVGTVMRALGSYPAERDLVLTYIPEMQDDEPTNFVGYDKFEKFMLNNLATRECEPDSSEMLLQAFRTIDSDNQGYVSAEIMEALLTSKGTAFRTKELEAFMLVAKNVETGNIFYEDYVSLLSST
jgi:calmodulin|eukprot:GSChrysophyteH1.ASY1.ANO1.84.1 assembled CDS